MAIIDLIGEVNEVISFASAIFAAMAWIQARAANRRAAERAAIEARHIRVVLDAGRGLRKELPLFLTRGELSRAELLGRIGMVPMRTQGQRFKLAYLGTGEFLARLSEVKEGSTDELVIPSSREEVDQFEI